MAKRNNPNTTQAINPIPTPEAPEPILESTPEVVVAVPVVMNTKKIIENRRSTVAELVHAKLTELNKPITHTGLFHEIYPGHPEGKEAVCKWNDIGKALRAEMTAGNVVESKVEGKRRTTYALKAAESTPEAESTEESPAA